MMIKHLWILFLAVSIGAQEFEVKAQNGRFTTRGFAVAVKNEGKTTLVLTAYHVVMNAQKVTLKADEEYEAVPVKISEKYDLALYRIEKKTSIKKLSKFESIRLELGRQFVKFNSATTGWSGKPIYDDAGNIYGVIVGVEADVEGTPLIGQAVVITAQSIAKFLDVRLD